MLTINIEYRLEYSFMIAIINCNYSFIYVDLAQLDIKWKPACDLLISLVFLNSNMRNEGLKLRIPWLYNIIYV